MINSEITTQEIIILQMMADGFQASEIAKEFKLSSRTIESHQMIIKKKLDSRNSNQAISEGFRRKLIK